MPAARASYEAELMQRFNAPLTPDDKAVARRIGRIILVAYSSMALALTVGVVAHIAMKHATVASVPAEATDVIGRRSQKEAPRHQGESHARF
jgi:hypothetical protein